MRVCNNTAENRSFQFNSFENTDFTAVLRTETVHAGPGTCASANIDGRRAAKAVRITQRVL